MHIYNSLTKKKEIFKPLVPNKVGIYVCGMTVYDYCHIGHARVLVSFDMVARYLKYRGYEVNYVRNITDIDDKIIARAKENNEDFNHLTQRFIAAMHEDTEKLNVLPVDKEPCATEYIDKMIHLIKTLQEKNYAYVGDNGDVFYDVKKFETYGALAHRHLDDMQSGARVAIDEAKRNPLDFVLWKMAKPEEPAWDSPWGRGRPGWHIECSAMSMDCLGHTFDIHGGGFDLKFPHHENEIVQSEAVSGKKFVNTWMHVGFVTVNKEKMSKSLGNFFTIREVLEKFNAEVVRYFMISSHYRSPVNYSQKSLEIAQGALERFYLTLRGLSLEEGPLDTEYEKRFKAAMDDDFNTPEALAVLFDLCHDINRMRDPDPKQAAALAGVLRRLAHVLGILKTDADLFLKQCIAADESIDLSKIEGLIRERENARSEKAWEKADALRDALGEMGIIVDDTVAGTVWRRG